MTVPPDAGEASVLVEGEDAFVAAARVAAARVAAARRFPYLAAALFAMEPVYARFGGLRVDAAWRLYVDPVDVREWSPSQIASVLVHHVGHLLRDHGGRSRTLGVRPDDLDRWALAADLEINDDLAECGLDWPEPPVQPGDLGLPAGRLAEEYHRRLEDIPLPAALCGGGSGVDARVREGEVAGTTVSLGLTPTEIERLRCRVAHDVSCASGVFAGAVPGGLQRWAEAIKGPAIDWRRILTAEVRRGLQEVAGRVDYSYSRPSRRSGEHPDVVLPSLRSRIAEVAIICDTSSSMSDEQLGLALGIVRYVARVMDAGRRGIRLLSVDAKVQKIERIGAGPIAPLVGRGGTNLVTGFDAIAAGRERTHVVVVLTDGHTPWPATRPKHATIIGLIESNVDPIDPPAWARTIRIPVASGPSSS